MPDDCLHCREGSAERPHPEEWLGGAKGWATVELFVNGHLVASLTDEAPAAGALGVTASSGEPGLEATFDEFLVAAP